MIDFDITGRVIILTGASGMLGRAYANALSVAGAKVIGWDKRMPKSGPPATDMMRGVDITDEASVRDAVASVLKAYGHIDAVINNAAMNPAVGSEESKKMFVPYTEYPIDLFRQEIDVNLVGMHIVMKAVAPSMIERRRGSIVNVASEVSVMAHDHRVYNEPGRYKSPAYTASKTGVLGLTRQWAAYLGQYDVRANAISIGGVAAPNMPSDFAKRFGATNMLGRMARTTEYGPAMIFLCSDASSFMTGSNLVIDGGKSAW